RTGLFRLGLLLARPSPGEARECAPRFVVRGRPDGPEDRPLEGGGEQHLAERHVAVLGLRRLLVVNDSPDLLEQLLAEESGEQAAHDAERDEEELHAANVTRRSAPFTIPAWRAGRSTRGNCRSARGAACSGARSTSSRRTT